MVDTIRNFGSIFVSPTEVAVRVKEKPSWALPFVVIIVINFVVLYITYPMLADFQKERMIQTMRNRGISEEKIKEYLEVAQGKRMFTATTGTIIGTIITALLASALLNLLSPSVGSKIGFRITLAYFCYILWIGSVGGIIRAILMVAKNTYDVRTSIAAFAPNVSSMSALGVILGSFDLFTIWSIIALGYGYAELANTAKKRSFALVILLWAATIGISVIGAKIGQISL
ncbi:MAG: YIP1 family protein [bacterium]